MGRVVWQSTFSCSCQDTLNVHWGKHHRTYVTNLNNQITDKPLANKTLHEVTSQRSCLSLHNCHSSPVVLPGGSLTAARTADYHGLVEQRQPDARV